MDRRNPLLRPLFWVWIFITVPFIDLGLRAMATTFVRLDWASSPLVMYPLDCVFGILGGWLTEPAKKGPDAAG